MPIPVYDIAIVGGGINGCGIARDAAGRGLTVHLCEQGDLAGAASSASTKLIHGDLRYVRRLAARETREALAEWRVLLASAPHLVRPLPVLEPRRSGSRTQFARRTRHMVIDFLGGGRLAQSSRLVDLAAEPCGRALKDCRTAIEYADCWLEDARLAVANAIDAKARGAHIHTRSRCVAARRADSYWRLLLASTETGERRQIAARALVNATGAWAGHMLEHVIQGGARLPVRLLRSTHIVTARLHQHDCAYALHVDDGRIVFIVPLEHDFTLIGPVDTVYGGDPGGIEASEADIDFLCTAASRYLCEPVTRELVRFVFSGVRALPEAGGRRRVESMLHLDGSDRSSPLLSVIGGRVAAYRRLAERVLARLSPILRMGDPWTAREPLPGGGFAVGGSGDLVRALRAAYPFLSELHAERLVNAYGTRAASIVSGARRPEDLGRNFGYDLTEAEVGYLMAEEWAVTAGDVLWRRSRLGLRFNEAQKDALGEWMARMRARATTATA